MVRVDQKTYDALQAYAESSERTISQVIRLAIRQLLTPADIAVALPLPGREKVSPLEVVKPKGGPGSVTHFMDQYGEKTGDE